jgi:hypothetical protein
VRRARSPLPDVRPYGGDQRAGVAAAVPALAFPGPHRRPDAGASTTTPVRRPRSRRGKLGIAGVWTIVALSVLVSIVLYELMTILETALLARWGPEAGVTRQ